MWVERTKQGGYKYCERYIDPVTNKYKKITKTFAKRTKGQDLLAYEYFKREISKRTANFDKLTFNQLIDMYLDDEKDKIRDSTFKNKSYIIKSVGKIIGHLFIKDTVALQIKTLLKNEKDSSKTHFNIMMNWAYKNKIIKDNELLRVFSIKPKLKSKLNDNKLIDYDKYMSIYNNILPDSPEYSYLQKLQVYMIIFMLNSGLRFGECAALTHNDIKDDHIIIDKSFSPLSRKITAPKNNESNRLIPLTNILSEIIQRVSKLKEIKNIKSPIVFARNSINPYMDNINIYSNLRKLFDDANLKTHNARHTYASILVEKGIDFNIIARILGHSDTKMLYSTYGHITKNRTNMDMAIIKNAFDN